ncbi:hypothetical protein AGOR_G00032780 [Albula goreensis]|uniref:Uncharacterized protein n=1 Tax=Albula goreensis TaxID=1534307 RepID=A0A8T3DV69_9TELE|nr:hypothetical protein AGOR_G00032780 [Albula goreensis]
MGVVGSGNIIIARSEELPVTQHAGNATGKVIRVFYCLKPIQLDDITQKGGGAFQPLRKGTDLTQVGSFVIPIDECISCELNQELFVTVYSVDADDVNKPESKLLDNFQFGPGKSVIFTKSGYKFAKPGEIWVDEEGTNYKE